MAYTGECLIKGTRRMKTQGSWPRSMQTARQRRIGWQGFTSAPDGAAITADDRHGQPVEKPAAYGEDGGPFNRRDNISEPMEEGSGGPRRWVRHPSFPILQSPAAASQLRRQSLPKSSPAVS